METFNNKDKRWLYRGMFEFERITRDYGVRDVRVCGVINEVIR
jgi:hypothetical protein